MLTSAQLQFLNETGLRDAAIIGDFESVQNLVLNNVDVNAYDRDHYSALCHAVKYNHFRIATFLVQNGAHPAHAIDGKTLLTIALENRETSDMALQGYMTDFIVAIVEKMSIFDALFFNDIKAFEFLLRINRSFMDPDGSLTNIKTPLQAAIQFKRLDVIERLVNHFKVTPAPEDYTFAEKTFASKDTVSTMLAGRTAQKQQKLKRRDAILRRNKKLSDVSASDAKTKMADVTQRYQGHYVSSPHSAIT